MMHHRFPSREPMGTEIMRVILVPLAGDADDETALAAAYSVARAFGAHVAALFVRPDLVDVVADFEGGSQEVLGEVMRATSSRRDERARHARQAAEAAGSAAGAVASAQPDASAALSWSWQEVTGAAQEIVPQLGRLADLIVLAGLDRGQRQSEFEAALVGAARPLLLVPSAATETIGRTVAVAWNGSAEATRALSGAMRFLERAAEVHLLTAAGARTEVELGSRLAAYLAWHGITTQAHALYPEDSIGADLLAKAKELRADLLVMGGYGHSRVRELIFGGVTRHVLHHLELPVLIAH
jgi:nucleotide-binding universal stress UspA family protein